MSFNWPSLLFGTAGVPRSSPKKSTIEGLKHLKSLGLDCMELEFVQGVRMKPELARKVKKIKEELDLELTVHAPYFINLSSFEEEKIKKSIMRIVDSARIGFLAGARSVTFHAAFYQNIPEERVFDNVKRSLETILKILDQEGIDIDIRPETTGKPTQFGTLEEILKLSREFYGRVYPCIDFAHLHARSNGRENSYEEFVKTLEQVESVLGKNALENMHIHISGIAYGKKGEKYHLNLDESDLKYRELLKAFVDKDLKGCVISESPNLEDDARLLKNTYFNLRGK